ncbi:hypothetical protein ANTQUA_LOCUS10242 [Anthophora quadrimaculata]
MGRFFSLPPFSKPDDRPGTQGSIKLLLFVLLQTPLSLFLASSLVNRARPDSASNRRGGYLSSLLTVTRAESISRPFFPSSLLSQVSQSSSIETLRLFGTTECLPVFFSSRSSWLVLGQGNLWNERNDKTGTVQQFLEFLDRIAHICSRWIGKDEGNTNYSWFMSLF